MEQLQKVDYPNKNKKPLHLQSAVSTGKSSRANHSFQLTGVELGVRAAPWNHIGSPLALHLTFFALPASLPLFLSLSFSSLFSFVFQPHEIKTSEEKKNHSLTWSDGSQRRDSGQPMLPRGSILTGAQKKAIWLKMCNSKTRKLMGSSC